MLPASIDALLLQWISHGTKLIVIFVAVECAPNKIHSHLGLFPEQESGCQCQ